jgi:hypothetical protein
MVDMNTYNKKKMMSRSPGQPTGNSVAKSIHGFRQPEAEILIEIGAYRISMILA